MSEELLIILVKLLVAHLIGDFLLQTNHWVKSRDNKKIRSKHLYYHVLVHGVAVYLLIANWKNFGLPLAVMFVHFTIDVIKIYRLKTFKGFLLDQCLHVLSILLIWSVFYLNKQHLSAFIQQFQIGLNAWLIIFSYIIVIWPAAILIRKLIGNVMKVDTETIETLDNTGKWIGIIERVLILTFILAGFIQAIGFLIAAKSVFRVKDIKNEVDHQKSEYILIGSLISFSIAIILGILLIRFCK